MLASTEVIAAVVTLRWASWFKDSMDLVACVVAQGVSSFCGQNAGQYMLHYVTLSLDLGSWFLSLSQSMRRRRYPLHPSGVLGVPYLEDRST